MERAVRKTVENQSKRWMQFLNLILFGCLLVVQCLYIYDYFLNLKGIIVMSLSKIWVQLFIKVVLLFLVI